MNILPNVQRKKVSPFISGPFSEAYHFFWNWKFQLEKDIAFLVAFYIPAAGRPKEEVSPGRREHLDRLPSALCFAALATLSWLFSIPTRAILCKSPLCLFIFARRDTTIHSLIPMPASFSSLGSHRIQQQVQNSLPSQSPSLALTLNLPEQ